MRIQRTRQDGSSYSQAPAASGAGALQSSRPAQNGSHQSSFMNMDGEQLAKALGWLSIGLGLAQIVAPREVARMIGISGAGDSQALMRLVGLRELVCGVGLLAQPQSVGWVEARVGGDMIDLALLGAALASDHARRERVALAAAAVLGVTALDLRGTRLLIQHADEQATGPGQKRSMEVKNAITINRSAEELYQFWRNFENLPRFMTHLQAVHVTGERQSHWKANAPAGTTVEWDAEITEDRPNELIAWRSLGGADVDNAGTVRFTPAPSGRGTEVYVEMRYNPPGGIIGATIAKLFGQAPEQQVYDDLRAFKQVIETGEVVKSDASIHRRPHAAQPSDAKHKS